MLPEKYIGKCDNSINCTFADSQRRGMWILFLLHNLTYASSFETLKFSDISHQNSLFQFPEYKMI